MQMAYIGSKSLGGAEEDTGHFQIAAWRTNAEGDGAEEVISGTRRPSLRDRGAMGKGPFVAREAVHEQVKQLWDTEY